MRKTLLRLGVNIDHAATLRQARGTSYPDLVEMADICTRAGAHGITVHLREDRRHIQDRDVYNLRKTLSIPLNLEMANSSEIVKIALDAVPDEVCMVPERRAELTTEGGLDVAGNFNSLKPTVKALNAAGITVSLFVAPDRKQLDAAAGLRVPCVELHTGAFCDAKGSRAAREFSKLLSGARYAHALGLQVNAGHGINMINIGDILKIPHLQVLNIGHSIMCRALIVGLPGAVREMLMALRTYRGGER